MWGSAKRTEISFPFPNLQFSLDNFVLILLNIYIYIKQIIKHSTEFTGKGPGTTSSLPSKAVLLLPRGHMLPLGCVSNPRRLQVQKHRLCAHLPQEMQRSEIQMQSRQCECGCSIPSTSSMSMLYLCRNIPPRKFFLFNLNSL